MRPSIVALIPARGGSKGVPGKNMRPLAGMPMIGWSILAARSTDVFDRVVVSTDSAEIADRAKSFGAEVPFLRPAAFAQDRSPDRDYVMHALDAFRDGGYEPTHIAILRPTTPIRAPEVLAVAVRSIIARSAATGLRSVHELAEPPQKMMGIEDGWLTGLFPDDPRPEYYNLPRQTFPPAFHPNGYVDVVTRDWLRQSDSGIFGPRVLGFVTEPVVEVDRPEDFDLLEFQVARRRPALLDLVQPGMLSQ
jgi:CMP-N,N'-diacetyllegionaminic acid synthase